MKAILPVQSFRFITIFATTFLYLISHPLISQTNFDPAQTNPFGLSNIGDINSPTFVDLDNDDDYDIISGETLGRFYYFENTGTPSSPSFATGALNSFGLADAGAKSDIAFVDIDGDGDLDGMSGSSNGIFLFHENTGTISSPSFAIRVPSPFSLTDVGVYSAPTLADLDNDGDLDLMSGEEMGSLYYYENIGTASDPEFDTSITNPFSLFDVGDRSHPTFIDLDEDGDFDLLVGDNNGFFRYFENIGTLTSPDFQYSSGNHNRLSLDDIGVLSTGSFADLDGDGDIDFISGEDQGDFYYHENKTAAPTFSAIYNFELAVENPFSFSKGSGYTTTTLGDLDNDGDLDLMTGTQNGFLQYYENEGSASAPSFATRTQNPFSLTDIGNRSTACFVDLDDDDDLDLMAGEEGGSFYYFENTGTVSVPSFAAVSSNPYSLTDIGDNSTVSFVDLDNDEDFDMMAGALDGNFYFFENTGTKSAPSFTTAVINPYSLTDIGGRSTVDFFDMDNDGDLDMMAGGRSGYFYSFENTGTVSAPSFGPAIVNNFSTSDIGDLSTVGFGDLDNDGDKDLISGELLGSFYYFERKIQSTSITWVGGTSTSWNNSTNWDGNIIPTSTDNVNIPDVANNPEADGGIQVNSLTIESGAIVTITTNNSILVNYDFVLDGGLDLVSGASLIPLGELSGVGSATVDRNTTYGISEGKYSIVGSPVEDEDTDVLGSAVYSYDETEAYDGGVTDGANRFISVVAPETMKAGDAYFSANTGNISFSGTPNSGDINLTLIYDEASDGGSTNAGFNLVSNPYTAAISYDDFVNGNADMDGTIYLWDDGGSNLGQRSNSDYITVTSMGATGGSSRAGVWDGFLRSAQGFFVKATTDGTLHFTPSMMDSGNNSDAGYYRKAEPETIRLSIKSAELYNDILIGFHEMATKGMDRTLDAYKVKGNRELQFYSIMGEREMAIQALPLDFKSSIDLGFDTKHEGLHALKLEEFYGDRLVYLLDHNTEELINLSGGSTYEFYSISATNSKRFSLFISPPAVLETEQSLISNELTIFTNSNELNIKVSQKLNDTTIRIYDLNGALINQVNHVDLDNSNWSIPFSKQGIFILSIITRNEMLVKKFIK